MSRTSQSSKCRGMCSSSSGGRARAGDSRTRTACRGASQILSHWPDHLTQPCHVAITLALCFGAGIAVVVIMWYMTATMVPGAFPVPWQLLPRTARSVSDQMGLDDESPLDGNLTKTHLNTTLNQFRPDQQMSAQSERDVTRSSQSLFKRGTRSRLAAKRATKSSTKKKISTQTRRHTKKINQSPFDVAESSMPARRSILSVTDVYKRRQLTTSAAQRCDEENETGLVSWYSGLSQGLLPLDTQVRFATHANKVFFVTSVFDHLTPQQLCAVKSAMIFHGNATYFIAIGHGGNRTSLEEDMISKELKTSKLEDMRDNVMHANMGTYLKGTLLEDFRGELEDTDTRNGGQLMIFAVQLATLWRFGGSSYGLDLITLPGNGPVPDPNDKYATLAPAGEMIRVGAPCHPVVFALMKALLNVETDESATVSSVIQKGVDLYCGPSQNQGCKGLRILDDEVLCSTKTLLEHKPMGRKCVWAKIHRNEVPNEWADDNCPEF